VVNVVNAAAAGTYWDFSSRASSLRDINTMLRPLEANSFTKAFPIPEVQPKQSENMR